VLKELWQTDAATRAAQDCRLHKQIDQLVQQKHAELKLPCVSSK